MKKWMFLLLIGALLIFACSDLCFAQDATPAVDVAVTAVTDATTAAVPESKEIDIGKILANETVLDWIFKIFVAIVGFIFTKAKWNEVKEKKGIGILAQAAEVGATKTYDTFVKDIKAKAEDGKLTKEEAKEAMNKAKAEALAYAKSKGVDLLKEHGEDLLKAAIEKVVKTYNSFKDKKKE